MYPHRIRLRGPWEVEPVARMERHADGSIVFLDLPVPPRMRMAMPCRWDEGGLENFAGRVRFRRRFGYPGRIDSHERVWLTLGGVAGTAEIELNGQLLGCLDAARGPFECDVTKLLKVRNELIVQVDAPEGLGGIRGEVALEVRCTAFLRAVRAWVVNEGPSSKLHVTGEVVGACERPLDLYVLLDGATLHYATTNPTPDGEPFLVVIEGLDNEPYPLRAGAPRGHVVRVDLVNGGVLWYVVEQVVG